MGDTVDDVVDDGVTPTPRGRKLFNDDNENFQAKANSFEEESKVEAKVRGILELRNTNKPSFIVEVTRLVAEISSDGWCNYTIDLMNAAYEILSDDDTHIKEQGVILIKEVTEADPATVK